MVKRAPNGGGFEVKKKIIKRVLEVVFFGAMFAVSCTAGSLEQGYIGIGETIVYVSIAFIALGVSGFLSGMLTLPDKR